MQSLSLWLHKNDIFQVRRLDIFYRLRDWPLRFSLKLFLLYDESCELLELLLLNVCVTAACYRSFWSCFCKVVSFKRCWLGFQTCKDNLKIEILCVPYSTIFATVIVFYCYILIEFWTSNTLCFKNGTLFILTITKSNDHRFKWYLVGMYLTLFATNWYIPFVILYNICIDIMISETVKFFEQLRHTMQGRLTMQNKRAKNIQIIQ